MGLKYLLFVFIFCAASSYAQEADQPKTLLEAIHSAIKLNPKTRSKDVEVEKLHQMTLGTKAKRLPEGLISCDYQRAKQTTNYYPNGEYAQQKTTDCAIDLSVTVWDGGAKKYAGLSAESHEKEIQNRNNSTNPLIQYTKGSIANLTMQAYLNLILFKELIAVNDKDLVFLDVVSKIAKSDEDKNRIQSFRNGDISGTAQAKASLAVADSDFRYNATVSPSAEIDRYEATIKDLKIPSSPEQAMKIALEQSPDIRATKYALEAAEYDYKSAKASLGPQVTFGIHADNNRYWDPSLQNSSFYLNSRYIELTVSLAVGIADHYFLKAQEKAKEQAALERDAALDDAKHSLESAYLQLETQTELEQVFRKNLEDSQKILDEIVRKIEAHDTNSLTIEYVLSQQNNYDNVYMQWQRTLAQIVGLKFSVLQVTGTLFEESRHAAEYHIID